MQASFDEMTKSVFDREESIVGEGENMAFPLFPQFFQKRSCTESFKG